MAERDLPLESTPRIAAVIPCYNHGATLGGVIAGVRRHLPDIIVVDDGSTDGTAAALAGDTAIDVIAFERNRGKGAALRAAFERAVQRGFTHAITVDADGQHAAEDLPRFIAAVRMAPGALWIGSRQERNGSDAQPLRSRLGRAFGAFWYRFHTGLRIRDTQCGFRAYPLVPTLALDCRANRYEYEIETLVRAAWNGMEVRSLPVRMIYHPPGRRVSHFRTAADFMRISKYNALFSLIRIFTPWRTIAVPGKRGVDKILHLARQELTANASPGRAAWSLALGVFLAIFPIHGFQVLTALGLSMALRLNRPLVLAGVSVSSAPFLPFIAVAAVMAGRAMLPAGWTPASTSTTSTMARYGVEFVAGSVALSLIAGVLTLGIAYAVLKKLRRSERQIPNPQSAIPNPQFAIRNSFNRDMD